MLRPVSVGFQHLLFEVFKRAPEAADNALLFSFLDPIYGGGIVAASHSSADNSLRVLLEPLAMTAIPAIAAIAAIWKEAGGKWALFMTIYSCTMAWLAAFIVKIIGSLL